MNTNLKQAFSQMKPLCDMVMVNPSSQNISNFQTVVEELKADALQELHQYLLYPFITHLHSKELRTKCEVQRIIVNAMREVLKNVNVSSFEMCLKIETTLLSLVFDKSRTGMIADVPEELKLSVMQCLTILLLNIDKIVRLKLLQLHVPLLAQAVFVSVHMAKLEKLRQLRLAAIECVNAHTATHTQLTDNNGLVEDVDLEKAVLNFTSSILPGLLAALQDVATSTDNPRHAIIAAALNTTHRIICTTMHNKHLTTKDVTTEDFANLVSMKARKDSDVSGQVNSKDIVKLTPEWFKMAGEKLAIVVKSLVTLVSHDHYLVRKELAILCYSILSNCSRTMQPSLTMALDVLISLSSDQYKEVSEYCLEAVNSHFSSAQDVDFEVLDSLSDNFYAALTNLPKILNNIDSNRKLSGLNLVLGYLRVGGAVVGASRASDTALALRAAVSLSASHSLLVTHALRDVSSAPLTHSPWASFSQLDSKECECRFRDICRALGKTEMADCLLDALLQMFHEERTCELIYIMNWMGSAPNSSAELSRRIISAYIQEDVWYSPLEVGGEPPVTEAETLDISVYNPRAWQKDSVPGLYEGATEIRYTDISYSQPKLKQPLGNRCSSLAEAQRNILRSCLLVEGLGLMALRLGRDYQPYLLKTLCLILERVGSKYEMLHLAGLKAINDVATAFGHPHISGLIAENADYFTSQITSRLKKAWDIESALQILSVVMEYSKPDILDYLYGIVDDVLVQSCDKYYQKNLIAYLQVFHTFVSCIRKWFDIELKFETKKNTMDIDVMDDVIEFIKNQEESERLLSTEEFETETGKSAEEMYREDVKAKDDNLMEYDDTVTQDTPPPPQHVKVTISIIKRVVHFVSSTQMEEAILALRVLGLAMPVLGGREELLPLAHAAWAPATTCLAARPPQARAALHLIVTLAVLAEDFIRSRFIKEVLPKICAYLQSQVTESELKDIGSAYRVSEAFGLQRAALEALSALAPALAPAPAPALAAARLYLARSQPQPLQELAVLFFKKMLECNYGITWQFLRRFCNNQVILRPPQTCLTLEPISGTPYETSDLNYETNIKLIFKINK